MIAWERASEMKNTQVDTGDSDPLFPAHHENKFLPSNPGSPPQRVESTSNEGVRKCSVRHISLSSTLLRFN